jgi:hypothetical protein
MAGTKSKRVSRKEIEAVELDPDAWPKFEQLIRNAAKTPPKPHAKAKPNQQRNSVFDQVMEGMKQAVSIAKGEADPKTYKVHKKPGKIAKAKPPADKAR